VDFALSWSLPGRSGRLMPTLETLGLFALAALVLAAMPGPGLFYVVGRTLASGRQEGLASCVGTALGGTVHVIAGTVGVSALVMESAAAFTVLKFCGGLYLIALAIQTWRDTSPSVAPVEGRPRSRGSLRALRQAFVVEATNPKTAAFFLALIPQFIALDRGSVALQFILLGSISVALNTAMDVAAVAMAASLRDRLAGSRRTLLWLRRTSAGMLGGLGLSVLLTRRPA
jgi:threonine/homoserine/homoserine lactone efflux protein